MSLLLYAHRLPDTAVPLCCYATDRLGHYMPNVSDLTQATNNADTHTHGCMTKVYAHARTHACTVAVISERAGVCVTVRLVHTEPEKPRGAD